MAFQDELKRLAADIPQPAFFKPYIIVILGHATIIHTHSQENKLWNMLRKMRELKEKGGMDDG